MSTELAERMSASPLVYRGQRAITLAMMDEAHDRPKGTAKRNFRANRDHLVEGEDYYLVPYVEWSQWVNERTKFVLSSEEAGAGFKGALTILTETGYLLAVKAFRDELAWKVQRELVRGYFRAGAVERPDPVALGERVGRTMECWHRLLSIGGLEERDRLLLKDISRNWMVGLAPAGSGNLLPGPRPVSILDRCVELDHRPCRGDDVKIGKAVAQAYRDAHGGSNPPKHTQYVGGRCVKVNTYSTDDLPVIDRAICDYFAARAK